MSPQAGHSAGKLHTLVSHLEHAYPPLVNLEWQAQKLSAAPVVVLVRDGNPIMSSEGWDCLAERVTGGVVRPIMSSRKCTSLRATR